MEGKKNVGSGHKIVVDFVPFGKVCGSYEKVKMVSGVSEDGLAKTLYSLRVTEVFT